MSDHASDAGIDALTLVASIKGKGKKQGKNADILFMAINQTKLFLYVLRMPSS